MAFLHCELFSNIMNMATAVNVVLPEEGNLNKVPVLMLLHGLSDNASGWSRYTACEQYAREVGCAVIMPEVQRSFYADMVYGLPYFTYIHSELPKMCQRMFGLSAKRDLNYIAGLSMGGYGALKCALTYPKKYNACGSFSGVTDFRFRIGGGSDKKEDAAAPGPRRPESSEFTAILGPKLQVKKNQDLFALAEKVKNPPRIYLSCGEQDFLYEDNLRFEEHLSRLEIPHQFDHREGNHTWRFWDQSLQDFFDFIRREDKAEN